MSENNGFAKSITNGGEYVKHHFRKFRFKTSIIKNLFPAIISEIVDIFSFVLTPVNVHFDNGYFDILQLRIKNVGCQWKSKQWYG